MDVVLEENETSGTLTQGHVDRLVHPYDDKKGCKVVLKESGKIGRVKKVYGKASRYDIDSPVDDSEEYYKKYPEERKKDEEERAAATPPKWTLSNIIIFAVALIIITLMVYFCYKHNIQIW